MENYCKVEMAGIVKFTPELKELNQNLFLCNFVLSVDFGRGNKKRTTNFRCVAWEKLAEDIYEKVSSKDNIKIKGSIENRRYKKKNEEEEHEWYDWWQVTAYECELDGEKLGEIESPEIPVQNIIESDDDIQF